MAGRGADPIRPRRRSRSRVTSLHERDRPTRTDRLALPGLRRCAYVVTADPSVVRERAASLGARVVQELHRTDYGSDEFALADPEGNLWSFGTYAGAP